VDSHAIVVRRLPPSATRPGPGSHSTSPHGTVEKRFRVPRKLGRFGINLLFVAMIAAVAIMLLPAAMGFDRYVILTGSMTGTYDRGSVVFDRPVSVSALKVGDPITYSPPPGFTTQKRVTHRIWWIGRGANGQRVFRTKGDANKAPDGWKFTLAQSTQDRVVFHVPYLGYLFLLLNLRVFRIVLIGVPALIIGLLIARGLWRDAGAEVQRQRLLEAGWQKIADPGGEATLPPLETAAAHQMPVRLDLSFATLTRQSSRPRPTPATTKRPRLERGARLAVGRLSERRRTPALSRHPAQSSSSRHLAASDGAAACRLRVQALSQRARSQRRAGAGRPAMKA
jgi:signal peptidase I